MFQFPPDNISFSIGRVIFIDVGYGYDMAILRYRNSNS